MRQCGENIVEADRPQMTIWRMRTACWIPETTDTQKMPYCFSIATMVARMRLDDTLLHCLSSL